MFFTWFQGCVDYSLCGFVFGRIIMCIRWVHVSDATDEVVFVLFDNDVNYLIDKQSFVLVSAAKVWVVWTGL